MNAVDYDPDFQIPLFVPKELPDLPGKEEQQARLAYVSQLLCGHYRDGNGMITLNGEIMKESITADGWMKAKRFLEPFWKVNHSYEVGKKSKQYAWRDDIEKAGNFVRRIFNAPRFIRRMRESTQRKIVASGSIEKSTVGLLPSFSVGLPLEDCLPPDPSGHQLVSYRSSFEEASLGYKHPNVIRDEFGKRLHHPISRMPKRMRKGLLYRGRPTGELDLSNSQPLALAAISRNEPLIASASKGRFYEDLMDYLGLPPEERDSFKKAALMVIYRRPSEGGGIWWDSNLTSGPQNAYMEILDAMEALFPGIRDYTDEALREDPTGLAKRLQRMESSIFIDTMIPRFYASGIPAVSLHDGFLIQRRDHRRAKKMLEESVKKATGLKPTVTFS
jgi:hypothetical protein